MGNNLGEIPDLTAVQNSLQVLRLSAQCITEIKNLQPLKKLKELFLENNQINRISNLDRCECVICWLTGAVAHGCKDCGCTQTKYTR